MFAVTRRGPDRVDVEFSGKLDGDGMRAAIHDLVTASEGVEHGRMLFRVGDFALPTLGALGIELMHVPALFRMIRRFDKAALVADPAWLRAVGQIEGSLFPGLDIRAFEPGHETEVEAWLTP